MDETTLTATRVSLHAVAELLLAGPQYDESRTIALRPTPGGFGCTGSPSARIRGSELLVGARAIRLDGRTIAEVAAEADLRARRLDDLYQDGPEVDVDHLLRVDEEAAEVIAEAFRVGDLALAALAPEARRVLWPEHFDLGITVGEVNYGVSPGDGYLDIPYAYVGPSNVPAADGFWNAPFGAARPLTDFESAEALAAFFAEGRERA